MENIKEGGSEDTLRTSQLQTLINIYLELKCISGTEVELLHNLCYNVYL